MSDSKPAYKPDFKKYDQTFLTKEQIQTMAGNIATAKPSWMTLIRIGIQAAILGLLYGMFCKLVDKEMLIDKQTYEQKQNHQDDIDVEDGVEDDVD